MPLPTIRHAGPPWVAPSASAALVVLLLGFVYLRVPSDMLLLERFVPGWGWLEIGALAGYAAWLTHQVGTAPGHARWRIWLWRFFSVVFFAQLLLGLVGFERFLMSDALHLPIPALIVAGPLYRGEGLFMPILLGATLLLVGPAWCSHLCYIGAWDDWAARHSSPPRPLPRWRGAVRVVVLLLVVGLAVGLRIAHPPPLVALVLASTFGVVGVGIMLLVSRRWGAMAHCTTWCPIGLVAGVAGKLSPFRLRIEDTCHDCGACSLVCRYDALGKENVEARHVGLSCTLCGECVRACRHDSIHYRFPGLSPQAARTLFLVLVISLHAIFLGLARM